MGQRFKGISVFKQAPYFLVSLVICGFFFGCTQKSRTEKAEGSVSVQIPVQADANHYELKTVELLGIKDLTTMDGAYAHFFYSPGSEGSQLTGSPPKARFVQSGHTFIPMDYMSGQMAALYYHMQNLATLDAKVGAGDVNQWPRAVGLETHVIEGDGFKQDNAFYDGQTDAMMFVPFTKSDLPISINAGIVAHEHFHSLFYKLVIKSAIAENKVLTGSASIHGEYQSNIGAALKMQKADQKSQKVLLYNEAYLRGLNEGLADFWGWTYTEDADFMRWSLPGYVASRSLTLSAEDIGHYQTKQNISQAIDGFAEQSEQMQNAIINYSYEIGTPHARFLKMLAQIQANESKVSVSIAKESVAQEVIAFLNQLKQNVSALKQNEMVDAGSLFQFIADRKVANKTLSTESCQFLLPYLNTSTDVKSNLKCDQKDGATIFVTDAK